MVGRFELLYHQVLRVLCGRVMKTSLVCNMISSEPGIQATSSGHHCKHPGHGGKSSGIMMHGM